MHTEPFVKAHGRSRGNEFKSSLRTLESWIENWDDLDIEMVLKTGVYLHNFYVFIPHKPIWTLMWCH